MFILLYLLWMNAVNYIPALDHAIYLSTLEISIEQDEMVIIVKVFKDDLGDALHAHYDRVIDTSPSSFIKDVNGYLSSHLKIFSDSRERVFTLHSVDPVGDSYQIHTRKMQLGKYKTLKIHSDYFMELFPTQQNVLHLKAGDKRVYHIFKKGKEDFEIKSTL